MNDLPRCVELLGLLFSQEKEFNPDPAVQKTGLEMIMGKPETGIVFVCEIDGIIQGMVIILFTVSTALGKKAGILEDMIVSPDSCGKGIGASLVRHAVDYAKNQGCGRITLLTDNDNGPARRFYEKCGFRKSDMIVFRKLIDVV